MEPGYVSISFKLDTGIHVESKRVILSEIAKCSILWAFWIGHCDCKKTHLARFVAIGHPMGRVRSSGHPHSLNYFQNTDE